MNAICWPINFAVGINYQQCSTYAYDSEEVIIIILKLLKVAIEIDEMIVPMEIATEYVNYVDKELRVLNKKLLSSPNYG